jgi:mRNA interferase MazF
MSHANPHRGEVWWVDFNLSTGSEIQKTRPAVIVSIDEANLTSTRVQVVPVTSNTKKLYPPEAYVTVKKQMGKAMADQLTTVSIERLRGKIETLGHEDMLAIERAIRVQLGL